MRSPARVRLVLTCLTIVFFAAPLVAQQAVSGLALQEAPPPKPGEIVPASQLDDSELTGPLQVSVVDGQDGVNRTDKKAPLTVAVQVRDARNLPLSGAGVEFTAPADGPSVLFSNGLRSISVMTDASGRAAVAELKPLGLGKFQIGVSVTFHALSGVTAVTLTNQSTSASAGATRGSGISRKTIAILAGLGAAAAVGIGAGLSHHGVAAVAGTSSTTTATIGLGAGGSVGAPH